MNDIIKKCHCVLMSDDNEEVNHIVYGINEKDDVDPCNRPINMERITERRKTQVKRNQVTPSPIGIESINNYNVLIIR